MAKLLACALVLTFSFLTHGFVSAQSLSERVGAFHTDFVVELETRQVDITSQLLIEQLRPFLRSNPLVSGATNVIEHNAYYFQFRTPEAILFADRMTNAYYYDLLLIDAQGNVLVTVKLKESMVYKSSDSQEEPIVTYSVSLDNVPVIILDEVKTMRFRKI